jgi:glycosyltransferase involved in cell wall biosynthesis
MSAPSTVNVLQVVDNLGMGGAETWLMEVLRRWSKSGLGQMDFLVTGGTGRIFDDEARELGARIHYVRYGREHLSGFARGFRKILRAGNYCAVHDHQDYASGWHFLLGGSALPPVRVTHIHSAYRVRNHHAASLRSRFTARIGKALVARYSTHIVGTSRQVITDYGFDTPRFRRIPKAALHCGFDPARFFGDVTVSRASVLREFGWPEDAKIILFAGRMDESPDFGNPQNQKNSAFAVSVGIACARRDSRICMLLAGKPSLAVPVLEQRIADAGLAERIKFAGIRSDIERLMCASDLLLFPSCGEGLGMVVVEAQAAGLPVLASTEVPRESVVVPELVRFQDVKDGEGAWAADLLQLVAQPRNIAAANQRVAASAFAIENSTRALSTLYRQGLPA